MPETAVIQEAADVTEAMIAAACEECCAWWGDSPIDWEELLDRLEAVRRDWDFGDSLLTPAIRKLQRAVRQHRREEH